MLRPGKADCKLPRPHQLRKSAFGEAFADASSARYKLFLADTLAAAIGDLANASKAISGGKLFTMSYFGYDLRIMSQLTLRPELDAICSTYHVRLPPFCTHSCAWIVVH